MKEEETTMVGKTVLVHLAQRDIETKVLAEAEKSFKVLIPEYRAKFLGVEFVYPEEERWVSKEHVELIF